MATKLDNNVNSLISCWPNSIISSLSTLLEGTKAFKIFKFLSLLWPCHPGRARSHLISETKQCGAWLSTWMGDHLGIPGAVGVKKKNKLKKNFFSLGETPLSSISLHIQFFTSFPPIHN